MNKPQVNIANPANTDNSGVTTHTFITSGHRIRSEDEIISLSLAAESLRRVRSAMEAGILETDELLDLSAEALDDAALSVKTANSRTKAGNGNERVDELFETVRTLAVKVLDARRPLLAKLVVRGPAGGPGSPQVVPQRSLPPPSKIEAPLVVWASQTGTSKKFASSLTERLKGLCGTADNMNMKDVNIGVISMRMRVYFVCSTFGVGRPPRDGEAFFASLRSKRDDGILEGVEFAVASLGNSSFEFFAVFGQMLSYSLQARGAEEVMPVALIDRREGKRRQKKHFSVWEQTVMSELGDCVGFDSESKTNSQASDKPKKGRLFNVRRLLKR